MKTVHILLAIGVLAGNLFGRHSEPAPAPCIGDDATLVQDGGRLARVGIADDESGHRWIVATLGDESCCLVRALTEFQTLDDAAPVHIYWSGDLATWQPALPLDEETPLHDYDLLADGNALWLAGVVESPRPVVKVWRLDARDARWTELPMSVELDSADARVRLLSSAVGAPFPKIVLPSATGTARVVPLAK